MNDYLHTTAAMLAVINPFVCGAMLLQAESGKEKKNKIADGTKVMLAVLVILLISAVAGKSILSAFGISMDAFQVVGGIILTVIGFHLLIGPKTDADSASNNQNAGLSSIIMFAASPGTISMVITLTAAKDSNGLPVSTMVGVTLAVLITWIIVIAMLSASKSNKPGGQSITSRFMGLLIAAMGLQFMLQGIKDFFLS